MSNIASANSRTTGEKVDPIMLETFVSECPIASTASLVSARSLTIAAGNTRRFARSIAIANSSFVALTAPAKPNPLLPNTSFNAAMRSREEPSERK